MKFYIADTHFGHESVINMCKRPFSSIEEMDETLIVNWNSVVSPNDEIYILGDFIFKSELTPQYYLDQLKGKKHLILGNHEKWRKQVACISSGIFITTELARLSSSTVTNHEC